VAVPNWWQFLLLALASFRVWRLLAEDTILDNPRSWIVGLSGWKAGHPTPESYRAWMAEFLTCSACFGFWISVVWWSAYQAWPHGTVVVAVPLAISTVVIGLASVLSDDE